MGISWNNMKIRSKILFPMILLGLLPLLAIGGYSIISNQDTEETAVTALDAEINDKLKLLGIQQAERINMWFAERIGDIEFAADNLLLQDQIIIIGDVASSAQEVTVAETMMDDFFADVLVNYDAYAGIILVKPDGKTLVWEMTDEIIGEFGTDADDPGTLDTNLAFIKDAPTTGALITDATTNMDSSTATIFNSQIILSHKMMDDDGTAHLGQLLYLIDMHRLYEFLVFKNDDGTVKDAIYEELGFDTTGEQYLVQISTKKLYTPSRFESGRTGVFSTVVNTDGVNNAIKHGQFIGEYKDYQGTLVMGFAWLLSPTTTETDERTGDVKATAASLDLGWVYLAEIYDSEAMAPIFEIQDQFQAALIFMAAIAVVAALIILGVGTFISNNLAGGIITLSKNMEKGSSGDLTLTKEEEVGLDALKSKGDEVGILGNAYSKLLDNVRTVVSSTQESTGILNSTSEDLLSGAEEINASSEEVASTSQAMSNGATSQTELIAEVNQDIKDTNSMVDEIIKKIQSNTEEVSQIALQTNILALNAGIEASRAGDYGRGFAVVAENVRKLSDQSKDAAVQIADVANEIADKLGRSFEKISTAMVNVVSVSEETAASAEEVAAAAEEMTATIEELSSAANELTVQAESSSKMINQFKLK